MTNQGNNLSIIVDNPPPLSRKDEDGDQEPQQIYSSRVALQQDNNSLGLSRLLQAYLVAVVLVNFSLIFLKGYSQDLAYWHDWVRQLSTRGYDKFDANYPPFYLHWLYLLGKFYTLTGMPLEQNILLKFLTQIPVTVFHCLLTSLIFCQLRRFIASHHFLHAMMLLTVLNPAILINGPIWGQVDLIPATMVFGALLLATHHRFSYLAIPVFTLALLTKFQMIAFAPVFGFLFFRNIGKHLQGIAIAVVLCALVFMPSIVAGHFWQAFRQAYIDTLGQYPMTTFNAANLWILLTGNTTPDSIILFGVAADSALAKVFTAKYFGMLLFSLVAFFVFIQGVHFLIKNPAQRDDRELLAHSCFAAMICAVGFFTLLPAMHERYLFPAVVMALAYSTVAQQKLIYPVMISLLCGLNMLIILEINGSDIWHGLAWLTVSTLVLCLLELIIGARLFAGLRAIANHLYRIRFLSLWVFIIVTSGMIGYFMQRYQINELKLGENQLLLTNLPVIYAKQDHGTMRLNRSFDNKYLSLNNRRYAQGIGTHSNSDIQYQLPAGAAELSFIAGLDDEVGSADVKFSVWGDDKLLWESGIISGHQRSIAVNSLDIRGIQKLNLKVAALAEDKWDHADWINVVVTVDPKPEASTNTSPASTLNSAD